MLPKNLQKERNRDEEGGKRSKGRRRKESIRCLRNLGQMIDWGAYLTAGILYLPLP